MQQLLCGDMHTLGVAVGHRNLTALIPCNLFAIWSGVCYAVSGAFNLAAKSISHPGVSLLLWLVVPQLLLVTAGDLWDDELDILGHQLALLPGHRLTAFLPCPDLLPILILLPQSHAVLLRHISALRKKLLVRDGLLALSASLLYKLLGSQFGLTELLRL